AAGRQCLDAFRTLSAHAIDGHEGRTLQADEDQRLVPEYPQVMLHSPEKMPLAVAVANMKGVYYTDYGLQMAATLLSVAPVLLLFLLLQRDFVSGLASGAVKG
ncbi:MAG: hypothetical protein AAF297_00755, partial [Planctomycetota bacterium]